MGNKLSSLMAKRKSLDVPVVVILGATGTGKSKLAIELAKKFNGEIISADSMQVYKGLDIITNKVTPEEQSQAVHHFINCVNNMSQYSVVDFRNRALPLINKLVQQRKMPIIVGGTNYYIESLLWNVLINPERIESDVLLHEAEKNRNSVSVDLLNLDKAFSASPETEIDTQCTENSLSDIFQSPITQDSFKDIPSPILHKRLSEVDPCMANEVHPNNKRKIVRSLQVYQQHKCCHSILLHQQKSQTGGSSLGGPLRFKNSVMLWLQCDKKVLSERLKERVDEMIERGLIKELLDFHKEYNENRVKENLDNKDIYCEGIFQSIGFKEFHEYLLLPEEERSTERANKLREEAIECVKQVTKKYAGKQKKWIKNRFLRKPDRELPPVYGLDATDLSQWEEVSDLASHIVHSVLRGRKPKVEPLPVEEGIKDVKETHYCEICDRVILGSNIWQIHLKSRNHHRTKAKLKKKTAIAQ